MQLAQAVENVRLDLMPALATADTQLTVEVAPELVVSFSPTNLRSIVYNLLSNAIKYRTAERPSQVRVRTEQTGATVVLTVQDNSLGLSEVQQRQLFYLSQRLHTHVKGTDVGLYITKRLVENGGAPSPCTASRVRARPLPLRFPPKSPTLLNDSLTSLLLVDNDSTTNYLNKLLLARLA